MRKRQFKKVLSLVLALAMVFTMNTSVFATGTVGDTDTTVVDTQEPAQPETPVNNETENPAPAEEPATEPEAPAPETTPEPAAEAAPVPTPAADPEPAVGDPAESDTDGAWTYSWTGSAEPNTKFTKAGSTITVLDAITVAHSAADPVADDERTFESNEAGTATITVPTGMYYKNKVGATPAFGTAGSATLTTSNIVDKGIEVKVIAAQATPPQVTTDYTVTTGATNVFKAAAADKRLEYKIDTSAGGVEAYADLGTDTEAAVLTDGSKKMYIRFKAIYDENVSATSGTITTEASEPAEIEYVAPEPEPGKWYESVSGYKFNVPDDAEIESVNQANKTAKVMIKKGEVTVEYSGGVKKALSIDVADKATLVFDKDSAQKVDDYSMLSLTGAGTVLLNPTAHDNIMTKAFESVGGSLSLSSNSDANDKGILISANVAGQAPQYITVINNKEAAAKVADGSKVAVVELDVTSADKDTSDCLNWDNTIFDELYSTPHALLSANKPYFTEVAAGDTHKIAASDDRIEGVSVKYGEKLIYFNGGVGADKSLAGAKVMNIPKKGVSKWKTGFLEGTATSYGIRVDWDTRQTEEWYGDYQFVLSTNTPTAAELAKIPKERWQTTTLIYNLSTTGTADPGKTYNLFARKLPTSTEFKSDPADLSCSFTTLIETSVSLDLASKGISPNYIGEVTGTDNFKALSGRTDVINKDFFKFTFNGFNGGITVKDGEYPAGSKVYGHDYTDVYGDNKYTVYDSHNFVLGYLTVHYGKYIDNTTINWSISQTYKSFTAGDGLTNRYLARVDFTPFDEAPKYYTPQDSSGSALWKSGTTASFNVIKAPVKVEPDIESPAVSDASITRKFKATNAITGLPVDATLTGAPAYLLNGKVTDAESWNNIKAGTYTVTVSGQGDKSTLASSNYELNSSKNSQTTYGSQELIVVDSKGSNGLQVTGTKLANRHVYYGTNLQGLKDALSANFTFGGINVTGTHGQDYAVQNTIKVLTGQSSNAAKAPASMVLDDTKLSKVSANTTVYAYYVDAPRTITGIEMKASSNAIPVTIEQRPVKVLSGNFMFKSKRGDQKNFITKISANKLSVEIADADVNYIATDLSGVKGDKFFVTKNGDIDLNTTNVNINKPGTYPVFLSNYTVSSAFAKNYTVNQTEAYNKGDKFYYEIQGRYYVKYILEYGGRKAPAGKRYVSSCVVDADMGTNYTFGDTANKANIGKPDKVYITNSWNGVLADGDTITDWDVRESTNLTQCAKVNFNATYNENLSDYDYAVYAVVSAKATEEGVMVESITPVNYTGLAHVENTEGKSNKEASFAVTLYDKGKTIVIDAADPVPAGYKDVGTKAGKTTYAYILQKGVDYTLSYKNNINASVAYDETVSGDDATFKRIVDDKKMPQVIVKGKGDYKSLKTTVLFDILPKGFDAQGAEALRYQQAGKNLNTKANVHSWLHKKLTSDGVGVLSEKDYKLRAGKYNDKKGVYTGDYIMKVYRIADNGSKTLLGEAKDLKKIPAGKYRLEYKGVNNYYGTQTVNIDVKNWVLFSQQKFKWTKKVDWKEKVTVKDFKIEVTNKKTKAAIPLVKTNTETGYRITGITNDTRNEALASIAGDWSDVNFNNAGVYSITMEATKGLRDSSDIAGTHTLKVEVKGTKLKATDFTIENTKANANKPVVIKYDGENTKKPVEVKVANAKLTTDEKNKIPVALGTKVLQANSEWAAENTVQRTTVNGEAAGYVNDDKSYLDTGIKYKASNTEKGVYTLAPQVDNVNIFKTYYVNITPSGKYYGPNADGSITLSYRRGQIDLAKAVGTAKDSLISITEKPVEVNIGGTCADLTFKIKGMDMETVSTDGTKYSENTKDNAKSYVYAWDPVGNRYAIFEVTFTNNKKVGKGKYTVKPTKYGKSYFKGTYKNDFTIKQKVVNEVLSMDSITVADIGDVIAEVNDVVAPKSGSPKISATLYQKGYNGKLTKLGAKDATIAAGKEVKEKGFPIVVTAGSSGNFKFENAKKEAKVEAKDTYFNVYGKKGKIKVTLSDGKAQGCVYDAAKKGYIYTGNAVDPKIIKVEIDGTTYNFPAGISTSSNFTVKYENDVKVGNATATITLKRNPKAVSGNEYPIGGSVKVKYKIVPHTNNDLVLEK